MGRDRYREEPDRERLRDKGMETWRNRDREQRNRETQTDAGKGGRKKRLG